jgi:uncharacterized protein with von Willebrand factor type A (vWA) domain
MDIDLDMDIENVGQDNRVYDASSYDEYRFEQIDANLKLNQRMNVFRRKAEELGGEEHRFPEELFSRFHGGTGILNKIQAEPWEPKVHEAISRDASFQDLERKFIGDSVMSGLATATLSEQIAESLEVFFKKSDPEDNEQGDQNKMPDEPSEAIWEQDIAVQEAVAALEEVAEVGDVMDSIGVVPGDGEDKQQDERTDFALFLLENEKAREAIKNAGRLYRSNSRAKKKTEGSTEVVGIECGGDLNWILPSELLFLRHPKARAAKLLEIIQEKTFQYKLSSIENKVRGPIVVLRDTSGSMRSYGRSMKAASIAIYTMKEANESNREIRILPFCTTPLTNLMLVKKRKEKIQPHQFQQVLSQRNSGSTNISAAIIAGCEMLGENENSDLVIVTDGVCSVTKNAREHIEKTKSLGARVYVIGVGADKGFSEDLKDLADEVIDCSDSSNFVAQCSGMKV